MLTIKPSKYYVQVYILLLLQVLLLVDASFGFEMETFEFLNILQTHGFPKVMGVLTHLDMFHSTKTLRKTKKKLKQRFWTEIYQVYIFIYIFSIVQLVNMYMYSVSRLYILLHSLFICRVQNCFISLD